MHKGGQVITAEHTAVFTVYMIMLVVGYSGRKLSKEGGLHTCLVFTFVVVSTA